MATHRNLRTTVRIITRAIAAVRLDSSEPTKRGRNWLAVGYRIDALEDRARNNYGEDLSEECVELRARLHTARDSATAWRIGGLEYAAGRVTPARELSAAELTYAAELRGMR